MNKLEHVTHTLSPVYDQNSKILILGSIPSPKSREVGLLYSPTKSFLEDYGSFI